MLSASQPSWRWAAYLCLLATLCSLFTPAGKSHVSVRQALLLCLPLLVPEKKRKKKKRKEKRRQEKLEGTRMDVDGEEEESVTCSCTTFSEGDLSLTVDLDTSIEAPPSFLPQRHYCDITGLEVRAAALLSKLLLILING